ncbi:DUF4209 domain-containing protein [Acinetobacter seifertii]|uniref:DUF4209 domain-containing protein n=1 Tax=Acinetobacter seifertii TaxID=1530123 RepID=UPI0019031B90|nr:DUF4209 domain-containing protein [Acinetobacter seifertii]MBJ9425143.1 DUF4209 domain-containing protein [Acinetobacter seifertii]
MTNTNDSLKSQREIFLECNWSYDLEEFKNYNYSSLWTSLFQAACKMKEAGKQEHYQVLTLLSFIVSLSLTSDRIHEPFKYGPADINEALATFRPEGPIKEDFDFFESILDDIDHPFLRARIADFLWINKKPKNPLFVRKAIDSYTEMPIDQRWYEDINHGWERALRLALQIKDRVRRDKIQAEMFDAINREISNPDYIFLALSIGQILDEQLLDETYRKDLAELYFSQAKSLESNHFYDAARQYYELAAKKYFQIKDHDSRGNALYAIAQSYENEAEARKRSILANDLYEKALTAYRAISNKDRERLGLEGKLQDIQNKIIETGKASLEDAIFIHNEKIDASDIVKRVLELVGGKPDPLNALISFAKLCPEPNYSALEKRANEFFNQSFFAGLFGGKHFEHDGRVIGKTPAINRQESPESPQNQIAIKGQMLKTYTNDVSNFVINIIMPALNQINGEHQINKALLRKICEESPIIPKDRLNLMVEGLWYGFEFEFAAAVHLLCPQLENIVRQLIKAKGGITATHDINGIVNEVGLSTLMERPEALEVFGKNQSFEIECIFTESLGFNLRNKVAHGLLNDAEALNSTECVFAWYMIFRLVLKNRYTKKTNFD